MDAYRVAFNTWQEKTEWVQKDKRFDVLLPWGKHLADVMKEYIDHLEAKCSALAAENAGLKAAAEFAAAPDMWEELGGNVMRYQYQEWYADKLKSAIQTPATDAFLAEVRAQGVEIAISQAFREGIPVNRMQFISRMMDFAAQLRQEAAQ